MIRTAFQKLVQLYTANGKFHSFVVACETGLASGLTSYSGGVPSGKAGWIALATFVGGFLWGSVKGWLRQNALAAVLPSLPPDVPKAR